VEVTQIGAAIGREFSHALLSAVVSKPESELASALDRPIAAGLLFRQGVPPHASCRFKLSLVQDAAYGTLLREPRRAEMSTFIGLSNEVTALITAWSEVRVLGRVTIWSTQTGQEMMTLSAQSGVVLSAQFSPEGHHVVAAPFDGAVQVWDLDRNAQAKSFRGRGNGIVDADISSDGQRVVIALPHDHRVAIWDIESGQERAVFGDELPDRDATMLFGAMFSPDGRSVITQEFLKDSKQRLTRVGSVFPSLDDLIDPVTLVCTGSAALW
jgi:WD40 repeat protein